MKAIRRIAVLIAGIFLISSCSILGRLTGNATTTGTNTGSALLNLYQLYQAFRAGGRTPSVSNNYGIDLSNASNLISLGQILAGASALPNATQSYTNEFSNAMMTGSSNLVNQSNLGGILGSLLTLGNANTSALSAAAANAQAGAATTVNNKTAGVADAMSALGTIFSLIGNR
jgi:hypothetical protein